MQAHAQQTGEDLARANGFPSFRALLASSKHIPAHGPEQFLATAPNGHRFLWGEDDIEQSSLSHTRGLRMSTKSRRSKW